MWDDFFRYCLLRAVTRATNGYLPSNNPPLRHDPKSRYAPNSHALDAFVAFVCSLSLVSKAIMKPLAAHHSPVSLPQLLNASAG
jgi:hypothetical protein